MTKEDEDEGYQVVANKKDLKEGDMLKLEFLGKSILLSMINGKVYAIDAICSHEDGPLEEGILDGYEVECPWHGSRFDVRTGEVRSFPADIEEQPSSLPANEWKVEHVRIDKSMLAKYLRRSLIIRYITYAAYLV